MLDEIRSRIEAEIAHLTNELTVVLPKAIKIAVEHGDLRENADYKSSLERQQFVQARLGQLTKRMGELSKIDPGSMPHDRVGFGSRVKLYDVVMAEEVSFTVVAGDFMDLDAGQVSLASPIGQGLLGAREGQEVVVLLPVGERRFKVLELLTLPQQLGVSGEE
jgi:transcription elongation factor GreA